MPTAARRSSSYVFFGNRFPAVVVWLAGLVLVGSCLLALDFRVGFKVVRFLTLAPELVATGQIWRLVTWAFVEWSPLGLIFGCMLLLVFGRDLSDAWGVRRFLGTCLTIAAVTALVTTLVGFIWRDVRAAEYLTVWPLNEALIIAWASLFPSRQMLFQFVVPLGGRNLIVATLGMTMVFAMLTPNGFSVFLPHFIAEGLMLAYMREPAIKRWFRGLRSGGGGRRKASHLRAVDRLERDEEPPRWLH